MLKILLIEETPVMIMGMDYLLRDHFDGLQVHIVRSTQKLQQVPCDFEPDVVLWAPRLHISREDKREGVRRIRELFPRTPLAVYSRIVDYESITEFFQEGVHGYVTDKESDELTDCLSTLLKGRKFISITVMLSILEELELEPNHINASLLTVLSPREWQVARYIAKGMRTIDIAQLLSLRLSTVNTIRANIYGKLNVNSAIELRAVLKNPQKSNSIRPD